MKIEVPELSLVVLIGASGMGKSTFAHTQFQPTEIVSSDACRAMLADDESDQSVTGPAFELLHKIVDMRLAGGRLTVVDATNVRREDRAELLAVAKRQDVFAVAVVFDLPIKVAMDRNDARTDRKTPPPAIVRQHKAAKRSVRHLRKERFRKVYHLTSTDDVANATVERTPMWSNRNDDEGPFDIIGDIHGCFDETVELLATLGYDTAATPVRHPEGRRALFVGDLVDRGPGTPEVLELVMSMVEAETALCVAGNHENKLVRALQGRNVKVSHGLGESLEQLEARTDDFRERAHKFMDGLVSHYTLDGGALVVCHAGLPERYHGRSSGRVRSFALYGDTTGETDDFGLPVRYPWAEDYTGNASVVYGHTPVPEAEWINNTICLDTGCVFGGKLTALRWPERELVSVPAHREHYAPTRPLIPEADPANAGPPLVVDVADVLGKHHIETELMRRVGITAGQSAAALEIMTRFAVDPRWLTYLPPTMAPVQTSSRPGWLEHPDEAFGYFRREGVSEVMCQEKHMGSRAVVTLARTPEAALERFGITNAAGGIITTRTGRAFFPSPETQPWEAAMLERLRSLITAAGWWAELETDWIVLDAELLPWSAKAGQLIDQQYAPVGEAGQAMLDHAGALTLMASERGIDVGALLERTGARSDHVHNYRRAWAEYCWPVADAAELELAPFQVLAAEGEVLARKSHRWHIDMIDQLVDLSNGEATGPRIRRTDRRVVALADDAAVAEATEWWMDMTERGGEGMVVKPMEPIVEGKRGIVLPGVKCRGREYLRMIYGPEYLEPANLDRLRQRGLGRKSSLARREFALGIEGLRRFVDRQHLSKVHQCVFGVLALESEPVDPRL